MTATSQVQKLYSVRMEVIAVVLATSERDAERVFNTHKRAIISDGDYEPECNGEVQAEMDLPEGWESDCLPYGCAEQRSIGAWLDLMPPPVVRDTTTIDMFGVHP